MKIFLLTSALTLILAFGCKNNHGPDRHFPVHNDSVCYTLNGHKIGYVYDTVGPKAGWRLAAYDDTLYILWHLQSNGFRYNIGNVDTSPRVGLPTGKDDFPPQNIKRDIRNNNWHRDSIYFAHDPHPPTINTFNIQSDYNQPFNDGNIVYSSGFTYHSQAGDFHYDSISTTHGCVLNFIYYEGKCWSDSCIGWYQYCIACGKYGHIYCTQTF